MPRLRVVMELQELNGCFAGERQVSILAFIENCNLVHG